MRPSGTELAEAVRSGVGSLLRYKLRTLLSVLGVVLGVASVVAMVSVGEGARRETLAQVQSLGLDNIVVRSRVPSGAGLTHDGLRLDNAARIRELVPDVAAVSPVVERHVRLHGATTPGLTSLLGVGAEFDSVLRLGLGEGRFLSAVDEHAGAAVCVVGAGLAARLADGRRRMVGEHVRLGNAHCEVVGVLSTSSRETSPSNDPTWRNLDEAALMPLRTLSGRTQIGAPRQRIDEIWLQIDNADRIEPAAAILERALVAGGVAAQDFEIIIPRQLLAQRQRTHRTFNVVTGSIAALALLVGGIGVMNVMLMSVVERTYEIGVRRAVGARRSAIRNQFLVEALLMTVAGGLVGIVVGVVLSQVITWYAAWPTTISAGSIAAAVSVSALVGLGFGIYPAITAARLIPMEALRRE